MLTGVTFNLLQATPSGTTLNISIEPDTSQITTAIESLVTNYNTFRDAVIAQQATDLGRHGGIRARCCSATAPCVTSWIQLQNALNSTVGGLTMADLGLSFNEKNELSSTPRRCRLSSAPT